MITALLAAFCITCCSLAGVFFFGKSGYVTGTHRYLLPLSVGVFLGVVFLELIPETLELSHEYGPIAVIAGFVGFYLLSFFLRTFHHHHFEDDACAHGESRLLLVGDAIHNFADGIVIASAFMVDAKLGVATTIGIALHEIPQEIVEFGILRRRYTIGKAVLYNLFSASSVVLGVLLTWLFVEELSGWLFVVTGVAAGNLLYIAASDLMPEVLEHHHQHFYRTFLATLGGILVIGVLSHMLH